MPNIDQDKLPQRSYTSKEGSSIYTDSLVIAMHQKERNTFTHHLGFLVLVRRRQLICTERCGDELIQQT